MHWVVIVSLLDNGLWPIGMAANWDQLVSLSKAEVVSLVNEAST